MSFAGWLPSAVVMALLIGAAALGGATTPFHYVDALAVVAVAFVPALLCLFVFAARDGRITAAMLLGPTRRATLGRLVALAAAIFLVPGNLVLFANQYWDSSPAEELFARVESTWVRTSRSSRTYIAGIAADHAGAIALASPLGRFSFYGAQPVRVPRGDYERIAPMRSVLVLRVHRGLFRFPWYERASTLIE